MDFDLTADLNEPEETGSFLLPAYGFERAFASLRFEADARTYLGPMHGPRDTYGPVSRDERRYLPRGTSGFLFGASAMYNRAIEGDGHAYSIALRDAGEPMPAGTYNICLMVHGPRLCRSREGDGMPAYAAWEDLREKPVPPVCATTWTLPEPEARCVTKTIEAAWGGRGALCALRPDGATVLLLVEFRIFDKDPERGDMLRVWASRRTYPSGSAPLTCPRGGPYDAQWRRIVARARRGYLEECGP